MARQYPDMNALQSAFDGDFQLLAVPSANFFNQEPSGDRDEIINALAHVRPGAGFKPNFPLFARSDVNGAGRLPVYSMALSRCPAPQANLADPHMLYYSPISQEDIRWNYEKVRTLSKTSSTFRAPYYTRFCSTGTVSHTGATARPPSHSSWKRTSGPSSASRKSL